jgi:hypothetical protein
VISVPLLKACALNWCVSPTDKHVPAGSGSILTEVTAGWTAIVTGPLVTPPAVTVIVAVPATGCPNASVPLQTTNVESQTPPHTNPLGEMVATAVLEELKVKVVATLALAEFTAEAERVRTCPATSEAVVGETSTWATVVLADLLPPHPAKKPAITIRMSAAGQQGLKRAFLPCRSKIRGMCINIEEFSV